MPRRRLGSGVPACALNVVSGCAPCLFCPDQDCWGHVTPGCGGQTHNRGTTRVPVVAEVAMQAHRAGACLCGAVAWS